MLYRPLEAAQRSLQGARRGAWPDRSRVGTWQAWHRLNSAGSSMAGALTQPQKRSALMALMDQETRTRHLSVWMHLLGLVEKLSLAVTSRYMHAGFQDPRIRQRTT